MIYNFNITQTEREMTTFTLILILHFVTAPFQVYFPIVEILQKTNTVLILQIKFVLITTISVYDILPKLKQ